MRAQLTESGQIVTSLAVGAWPREGRGPADWAASTASGLEGNELLARGHAPLPELPSVPWIHKRIASGLEQVWWFVEHGDAAVAVVLTAHPSLMPSVRDLALPSIASLHYEPAPPHLLLDPGFQVAAVTIDESRRVHAPGTPISLVLPADWGSRAPTSETEVLAREGMVGASQNYGLVQLHRMPFPGHVQGDLDQHLEALERNARQSLGLRETLHQGSFSVSGRSAIFLEGRAEWPLGAEALQVRLVLALVADGGMCYQLGFVAKDEQFEELQPIVLEGIRSLRLEGSGADAAPRTWSTAAGPTSATRSCSWCGGQGTVACSACSGRGRAPCASCRGTGKRGGDYNQALGSCFGCFGSQYTTCGHCLGQGRQPCTGCGRTGRSR